MAWYSYTSLFFWFTEVVFHFFIFLFLFLEKARVEGYIRGQREGAGEGCECSISSGLKLTKVDKGDLSTTSEETQIVKLSFVVSVHPNPTSAKTCEETVVKALSPSC